MFEIVSILSCAPAVLSFADKALEFGLRVKGLRKQSPPRPLTEGLELPKIEAREIHKMYAALEEGRPMAADIAGRAWRKFLFTAGPVTVALVAIAVWVYLSAADLVFWALGVFMVCCVIPLFFRNAVGAQPLSSQVTSDTIRSLGDKLRKAVEQSRSVINAVFAFSRGVSIPEMRFLDTFLEATAMLKSLECNKVVDKLKSGMTNVHNLLTTDVVGTVSSMLFNLAKENKLSGVDKLEIIQKHLEAAGFSYMMDFGTYGDWVSSTDFNIKAKSIESMRAFLTQRFRQG